MGQKYNLFTIIGEDHIIRVTPSKANHTLQLHDGVWPPIVNYHLFHTMPYNNVLTLASTELLS